MKGGSPMVLGIILIMVKHRWPTYYTSDTCKSWKKTRGDAKRYASIT